MKTRRLAILSTLLFFTPVAVATVGCSEIREEAKELTKIQITSMPSKLEYEVGETLDLTGMVVTATYSDGTTEDVTDKCTTNKDGVKLTKTDSLFYVKYTYEGKTKTASVKITVITDPVIEVNVHSIDTLDKLSFPWEEVEKKTADYKFWTYYNSTTMKCDGALLLNKKDGSDTEGTFRYVELNDIMLNIETGINEYKAGILEGSYKINSDKQIKLTTTDLYKTVDSEIGEPVHLTSKYDNAQYEMGTVIYNNGEIVGIQMGELLKASDTFFGWGKTKESDFVENISTNFGYSATQVYFDIVKDNKRSAIQKSYWAPKYAESIEVKQMPTLNSYYEGDILNTAGLELIVHYTDGTTANISEGFTVDKTEPLTLQDTLVTVTYMEKTVSFPITVSAKPAEIYVESIEVTNAPKVLAYSGSKNKPSMEELVKEYSKDMVITAHYSDGSTKPVNSYIIEGEYGDLNGETPRITTSYVIKYSEGERTLQHTEENVTICFLNAMDVVKHSGADIVLFSYFTKAKNKVNCALELTFNESSITEGQFIFTGYSTDTKASFVSGNFSIEENTINFTNCAVVTPLKSTGMFTNADEKATIIKDGNNIIGLDFGTFSNNTEGGIFGYAFDKLSELTANIADVYHPEEEGSSTSAYMHNIKNIDFTNETVAANIYYNSNI